MIDSVVVLISVATHPTKMKVMVIMMTVNKRSNSQPLILDVSCTRIPPYRLNFRIGYDVKNGCGIFSRNNLDINDLWISYRIFLVLSPDCKQKECRANEDCKSGQLLYQPLTSLMIFVDFNVINASRPLMFLYI